MKRQFATLPGFINGSAAVIVTLLFVVGPTPSAAAQPIAALTKIAAGTVIEDGRVDNDVRGDTVAGNNLLGGWTDRVLIASPRVASGDVDQVSSLVKKHAELLSFVILARVEQTVAASGPPMATLQDVGFGLAAKIDGRLQVVSGPPAQKAGAAVEPPADLGFIGNRVLRSGERSLDEMRLVVRRTTLLIYDSPAVINLSGSNQHCVIRSMIWVEPQTGKLHHALWAMQKGGREPWIPALPEGVYLPVPTEEDRILHVDVRRFSFGIPAASAFGLKSLPPGYSFSLAGRLEELACRESYDEQELGELAVALISALRRDANP
jgi:hypothetical protein